MKQKPKSKFLIGGAVITTILFFFLISSTISGLQPSVVAEELTTIHKKDEVNNLQSSTSAPTDAHQKTLTTNAVVDYKTTQDLVPWEYPTNGWNPLIAHGFGEWNGILSPNNYEAFRESYDEGFRAFETDIMLASDGIPILAHDRQEFNYYGLSGNFSDHSSSEFLQQKLKNTGTTLAGPQLLDLLKNFPDIRIVLDLKIENQVDALGWFLDQLPKSQWPRLLSNIRSEKQMQELVKRYPDYRGSFFQLGPWREDLVYTDREVEELVINYNLAGVFTWIDELDPSFDFIVNNKNHKRWTQELENTMNKIGKAMIWHTTDDPELIHVRRLGGGAIITNSVKPKEAMRGVIISIDGLTPKEITPETTPNLMRFLNSGAYTLQAKSILPSGTLPSHASMLTGSCPATHGITWNDYKPDNGYANSLDLFELADGAGLRTAMLIGKIKLSQITEPENIDYLFISSQGDKNISTEALQVIDSGFDLLFIHLPDNDILGHEFGWLSNEQLINLTNTDKYLGEILNRLEATSYGNNNLIIITSDHGGHEKTHGSNLQDDVTVPWVISAIGVKPQEINIPISIVDTSPTIAWAMDFPIPLDWEGQAITEAFGVINSDRDGTVCQ